MHYNPSTGKRIKDETIPRRINWLHTTLKRRPSSQKTGSSPNASSENTSCPSTPDIDAYHDWLRRTADFPHLNLKVSDLLEKNATPEARTAHLDLADWLIQYLEDKNA